VDAFVDFLAVLFFAELFFAELFDEVLFFAVEEVLALRDLLCAASTEGTLSNRMPMLRIARTERKTR